LDSSAADAVMTLKDEPGMKSPALARLRRGAAGVQFAVILEIRP
jgi:Flp pilus assembly protein TadG